MYDQDILKGWTLVFGGCFYGVQRLTKRNALIYCWEEKLTKYNANILINYIYPESEILG